MNKQQGNIIIFIGLLITAAVLNYYYGNSLSIYLSAVFVSCIFYFFYRLRVDGTILMGAVFLFSIITLHRYILPMGTTPYFLNTDHNAITNEGVAFRSDLTLFNASTDANAGGVWSCEAGSFIVHDDGNGLFEGRFQNFATPVFFRVDNGGKDPVFAPVNNVFPVQVDNGFTISGEGNEISFREISVHDSIGPLTQYFDRLGRIHRHEYYTYIRVTTRCAQQELLSSFGQKDTFSDTFTIVFPKKITQGIALYDLFFTAKNISGCKDLTYPILEQVLNTFGKCYLLANTIDGKSYYYTFFPSQDFLDNNYHLCVNGVIANPHLFPRYPFHAEQPFFVGLLNHKRYRFTATSATDLKEQFPSTLQFETPKYFSLSGDAPRAPVPGSTYVRFLYNNYHQLTSANLGQGYLFHEDLRPARCNVVDGVLEYVNSRPGHALQASVRDTYSGDKQQKVAGVFTLRSADGRFEWLYHIRDFSDNNFSFFRVFTYLTILFLAIVLILLFNKSNKIGQLEPVIFAIIYCFIFIRYLMLWRIATFPPLDNLAPGDWGKYFDYDILDVTILGVHPLKGTPFESKTLLLCLIFIATLYIFRQGYFQRWARECKRFFIYLAKGIGTLASLVCNFFLGWLLRLILRKKVNQFLAWKKEFTHNNRHLIRHILVLIFLSVVWKLKLGSIERFLAIIFPVVSYLYFSMRITEDPFGYRLPQDRLQNKLLIFCKEFIHYATRSPEFYLSVFTLMYLALVDRGFAILFFVFLLLKNILVSFSRKPFYSIEVELNDSKGNMRLGRLLKPHHYWIYGLVTSVIYFIVLWRKDLFFEIKEHKIMVLALVILLIVPLVLAAAGNRLQRNVGIGFAVFCLAVLFIWKNPIDTGIDKSLRYVVYRATMLYQPVEEMIAGSSYNTFEEHKIIETAEGQWFINSYIQKPFDRTKDINLQPFFNRGVNYTTQTRDVVLARFVIAEFGSMVMVLLLALLALPLMLYLVSFRIYKKAANHGYVLSRTAYPGLLGFIFLFSLALFVWLTSTNRFVFFGQDFPFLSLTSMVSLILPLMLLFVPLTSDPEKRLPQKNIIRPRALLWGGIIASLILVIYATSMSNNLRRKNFEVYMKRAECTINDSLNTILADLQQKDDYGEQTESNEIPDPVPLMHALKNSHDFQALVNRSDKYTASVMETFVNRPGLAFRPQNPIYLRYDADKGEFSVSYNRQLYLEPPAYDIASVWHGNIYEDPLSNDSVASATIRYDDKTYLVSNLPAVKDFGAMQIAVLPGSWFKGDKKAVALINLGNTIQHARRSLEIVNADGSIPVQQDITSYVNQLGNKSTCYFTENDRTFCIQYNEGYTRPIVSNLLVNGKQRMVYPLSEKCFWAYQYANAANDAFTMSNKLDTDTWVTLDLDMTSRIYDSLQNKYKAMPKNFHFSAIVADGDGNIRLMADFVRTRKVLDPNNEEVVNKLMNENFFYKDNKFLRDQWGNRNLIHLYLGPGSSIKPMIMACVSSQVNAGWQHLQLVESPTSGIGINGSHKPVGYFDHYAGFELKNPWYQTESDDNSTTDIRRYIFRSNNNYHSVVMFLGSYPFSRFYDNERHTYSLYPLLTRSDNNHTNYFPSISYDNKQVFHLLSYNQNGWPRKGESEIYFGDDKSILAEGLAKNARLSVIDEDKTDSNIESFNRVNYGASLIYDSLQKHQTSSFLWSFPEMSFFVQAERAVGAHVNRNPDIYENFINGLKNPTLGARPYYITPLKMAEMYGKMASQNSNYELHVAPKKIMRYPWQVDNTWNGGYLDFLQQYIFQGMKMVLETVGKEAGTAWRLYNGSSQLSGSDGRHYFLYAKTGTISSKNSKGQSRRLELIISQNEITQGMSAEQLARNKFYTIYFAIDNRPNGDHDFDMYRTIITQVINSNSFKNYMER